MTESATMRITTVAMADLTLDPSNARVHPDRNIDAIKASLKTFGQKKPIVVQEEGLIVRAGNGTVEAARSLGWTHIAAHVTSMTNTEAIAYAIADNRTAETATWDDETLGNLLSGLRDDDMELLGATGFSEEEINELLATTWDSDDFEEDVIPEPPENPVSKSGQVWALGRHRLMCGDSTKAEDVTRLMDGSTADLVHADPPYGMGKEADGVANDNLYGGKLDAFQMEWVKVALGHAADNCGVYIWGNAPDLWRLWYVGGMEAIGDLIVRNEIVWAKGSGFGMTSEGAHSYPPETERCLFLMRGQQFLGLQNKDDYWEGYELLRAWLCQQRDAAGFTAKDIASLTGTQMAGHWFGKSQFAIISREHYDTLRTAADGLAFVETYDEMSDRFGACRDGGNAHRRDLAAEMREMRSYFDNTHDTMTDVWEFPRVTGEERHGHATPKPVLMIARAIKSSCPKDGIVLEPFIGSGSTLVAAEHLGRTCRGVEINPQYVDVTVKRWEALTGEKAEVLGETPCNGG